jgi:hypothetical protein
MHRVPGDHRPRAVVACSRAMKVGRASCPKRPPWTHGSPRRRRRAVLIKPDSGQGSRGAPFGVHRPAIRARIPRMCCALRLRWLVQARRSGMQGTSLPRVSLQAQIPHRFFVLTSAARSARERPMLSTRRRSPAARRRRPRRAADMVWLRHDLGADVGRRTTASIGTRATAPAKSSSGRVQLISAR